MDLFDYIQQEIRDYCANCEIELSDEEKSRYAQTISRYVDGIVSDQITNALS